MPLSSGEQHLCRIIEQRHRSLLDDLRLHVSIPTGGFNTPALDETRERFAVRLASLGATLNIRPGDPKPEWLPGGSSPSIPPTLVASRLQTRASARVLIAGHLDTVHDPQGPFRELSIASDGKTATGPGCVDMKGGLVIAVAALEALEEAGLPASWSFLMNSDEETGSYHSEAALRAEAAAHDVGLAIEPALPGGALAISRLGSGQFMVEAHGKAAHVGREFEKGVSAVTALARVIVAIGEMPDVASGRIINIGPVQGGVATNVVPDLARAWGNVRFPNQGVADELDRMLETLTTRSGGLPAINILRSFNRPAKPETPGVHHLALAARGVAEDLGQTLPFASTGGVCDGNILQSAGLPTIDTLGVRGGGLHTPNEWIELASLVERCQMLGVLIHRLSTGTPISA